MLLRGSWASLANGDKLSIISVFAEPPKESLISCVSLWLRYGTNFAEDVSAEMTSPAQQEQQ